MKKDSTSAQLAGRRMNAMNVRARCCASCGDMHTAMANVIHAWVCVSWQFLTLVTDIGAYMARTAALVKNGPFGNGWYNSTSFPEWAWQGDTSADEVAGHMFAFPAAQRLLGNATGQQTMIYDRIERMIGYILTNHYFEVGHDGQHTKYEATAPCSSAMPMHSYFCAQVGNLGTILCEWAAFVVRPARSQRHADAVVSQRCLRRDGQCDIHGCHRDVVEQHQPVPTQPVEPQD